MALLRVAVAALTGLAMAGAGCSLVLDPSDLTADRLDGQSDTLDGDGDATTADTAPLTDSAAGDTTTPDTVTVDTSEPGPHVVIKASGVGGCELDYHSVLVTGCPETCPDKGGWTLVFDATASTGVTGFDWRFSATEMYDVQPKSATGGRVEITLDVPGCELLHGATIGSASVYATLTINGDADATYPAQLDFSVRQVSGCATTQGTCAEPQ